MTKMAHKSHQVGVNLGTWLGKSFEKPISVYTGIIVLLLLVGLIMSFMDPKGLVFTIFALIPIAAIMRLLYGIRREMQRQTRYLRDLSDLTALIVQKEKI